MKNNLLRIMLVLILTGFCQLAQAQKKYLAKNSTVNLSFYVKKNPVEIPATNESATSALLAKTGKIIFSVPVQEFRFKRAIIQKYFNYPGFVYSKKYPYIKFKGQIVDFKKINLKKKKGEYPIVIEGELTMRGVTKPVKATGKLVIISKKELQGTAWFTIPDITVYGLGKVNNKPVIDQVKGVGVKVNVEAVFKR